MPPDIPAGNDMVFLVGGYDPEQPDGRIFEIKIPTVPSPNELLEGQFGAAWGGQREIIDRVIQGFDPLLIGALQESLKLSPEEAAKVDAELKGKVSVRIPYPFLPLQDCVDLSTFLIRATITIQKWFVGVRGVGGFIDAAVITKTEPFKPVQQKQIHGELQVL